MIKIDTNTEKELRFEIKADGINNKDLTGSLRITFEGVEYGFPVNINEENISVVIPPLKNVVARKIKNGEKVNVKLEMNGNGFYLNPWNSEFLIESTVVVEAKLLDTKPIVNVQSIEKKLNIIEKEEVSNVENKFPKKVSKEQKKVIPKKKIPVVTETHIYKFMEMNGVKTKKIQETLYNQALTKAGSDDKKKILLALSNYFGTIKKNKI